MQVVCSRIGQRLLRHQTDDLAFEHVHAIALRFALDEFERAEERRLVVLRHVHRDLHHLAIGQVNAERLDIAQAAIGKAHGFGNGFGHAQVARAQVRVVRDEWKARADGHGAGFAQSTRAEVGCALRIGGDFRFQALVLTAPDVCQVAVGLLRRRVFVQVHGNVQFVPDALAQSPRNANAVLLGCAADGDEWDYVRRAHARVPAPMRLEVDEFRGFGAAAKGGFLDGRRIADECDDRAVVVRVHLLVQQCHTVDGRDGSNDLLDHVFVSSFAEIRHALDELTHIASIACRAGQW